MKKLQDSFTTPEQSKRLLELGVPADSSDCAYRLGINEFIKHLLIIPKDTTYTAFADSIFRVLEDRCLPCWSVGRLIEIYNTCCEDKAPLVIGKYDIPLQRVLIELHAALKYGWIDFSKLEED